MEIQVSLESQQKMVNDTTESNETNIQLFFFTTLTGGGGSAGR